jgi:lipopolysaccharide transport system permease protein
MSSQLEELTLIEPVRGWRSVRLGDIWDHRELLYFLVWRDIKVRYKQTAFGVLWAVVQPLLMVVLFTLIFDRLTHVAHGAVPYAPFVYVGLVSWQLFSTSLTRASDSLVVNPQLIEKVYFPRVLIPLAAVLSGVLDALLAFLVMIAFLAYYGIAPGVELLSLPVWMLLAVAAAAGVSLWLSALNVKYRDVRYTMPFVVQFWFFATPIVYAISIVPADLRPLVGLNPAAGVVAGARWAFFPDNGAFPASLIGVSACITVLILVTGLFYFSRLERTFADVI